MTTVGEFMAADHEGCDEMFVDVGSAVTTGNWNLARERWDRFEAAMRRHFEIEEEILFPEIERSTGMPEGPTEVMRMDHRQMRSLFQPLVDAITTKDSPGYLGLSETMMVMIQQHNMKEEQVLYPLAEDVLPDPDETIARMHALRTAVDT